MKKMTILKLLAILGLGLIVFAVIKGFSIQGNDNLHVRHNCIKTNLFVKGDKGHTNRVYDCNGTLPPSYAK